MRGIDITGERFGRLVAFRPVGSCVGGVVWYCLCDCGGRATELVSKLRHGRKKSCGCMERDRDHLRHFDKVFWVHGLRARGFDVVEVFRQLFDVKEADECLKYLAGYPIEVVRDFRPIPYRVFDLGDL